MGDRESPSGARSWTQPVAHWRTEPDPHARHLQLGREAELLTRWPPAPFESSPTDCFRLGPEFWIWQPGVGGIQFFADRPEFVAYPSPDIDRIRFAYLVERSWLPAIYQVWGRQVLHASAVARRETGVVVAFSGPGGAGKSTLAYGLARRGGWIQATDDTLAFSCASGATLLHPLLNEVRLRRPTADHFGRAGRDPEPVVWPEMDLRLGAVFLVQGDEEQTAAARISRLSPAETYLRLLQQAHAFTLQVPEYNQRLMRDYLALIAATPAFDLTYRKSFDALDAVLDAIETSLTP